VLGVAQTTLLVVYALAQALLALYSSHRYLTLWRWWRSRPAGAAPVVPPQLEPAAWPVVTVQLPIFNERLVAERLVEAVAALRYPAGRLEIQVLDDSTDATRRLVARAVERHRARGVDIRLFHRERREGFKAGALAHGLARARGELIAVFDADFVPAPDFLVSLVPRFSPPDVGMVQARWSHLNRSRSALTAAQAVMLDAHFLIEHRARMASGLFFNFNGTAGLWRRACLEDAGGWSGDTLTEDLDLSYRAQLRGWRFVLAADVEAPAELPVEIGALKSQQRRWVKGSIQTARKILPRVFAAPLPWRVKLEAFVHLTGYVCHPLLLLVGLLTVPVLLGPRPSPLGWVPSALVPLGIVPVAWFLVAGQRAAGGGWRETTWDVFASLVLGLGLSFGNSRAVLEGMSGRIGAWERTPKTGDGGTISPLRVRDLPGTPASGTGELALGLCFAALAALTACRIDVRAAPSLALLALGFITVGIVSQGAARESERAIGRDSAERRDTRA
jgi:membrane glycosyltransferase